MHLHSQELQRINRLRLLPRGCALTHSDETSILISYRIKVGKPLVATLIYSARARLSEAYR